MSGSRFCSLFVGTAFLFHGSGKIGELESFAQEFGVPVALAADAAYGQLIGAILLIAGLFLPNPNCPKPFSNLKNPRRMP